MNTDVKRMSGISPTSFGGPYKKTGIGRIRLDG